MAGPQENLDVAGSPNPSAIENVNTSGAGWAGVALILGVVLVVAGGAWYAVHMARQVLVVVNDAYAVEWTTTFIIEHMKANNNQGPRGWEDLKDEHDRLGSADNYPCPWEKLQTRVVVDWNADPVELAKADIRADPPFRVIRIVDGSKHQWKGMEPNRMNLEYLLESSKVEPAENQLPDHP